MAQNGITYVGRLINNERMPAELAESSQGNPVLKLVIVEDHQERNDRAAKQYQDNTKAADAYVNTTSTFHRVTVFGDTALDLASDPGFNHMALVQVTNAQYREEDPWEDRGGVKRAGRPETIGKDSEIGVFERNGQRFEAREEHYTPIWDGGPLPKLKGSGGGGGGGRVISDSEGF